MKADLPAVLAALLAVRSAAKQTATIWLPDLGYNNIQLNADSGAVVQVDGATTTLVLSDPSGLQYTATYVSKTILTLDLRTVDSEKKSTSIAAECTLGSEGVSAQCSGQYRQKQEPRTSSFPFGGVAISGGSGESISQLSGNQPVHDAIVAITQGSLPTGSGASSASPGAGGGGGSDQPSATTNGVATATGTTAMSGAHTSDSAGGKSTAAAPSTTGAPSAANSSQPPSTTSTSTSKGGAAPLGATNVLSGGAAVVAGWLALLL